METYRLNSKLVDDSKEYLIQTTNDVSLGSISSEVYVDGLLADVVNLPHPEQIKPEEVLALVQTTHDEKKREIETLLKAYHEALESANAEMMYHMGLAFFYRRFYGEAQSLFTTAIGLNESYHEAYNLLGQTELALGNVEASSKAVRSAVELRPQYADYRNNFGEALMASMALKEAQQQFEKAIEINLYYSDAYFNLGLALIRQSMEIGMRQMAPNLTAKANDYFNKASLIYPDYKTAVFERGLTALKAGDTRQAFALLRKVREEKKEAHARRYAPYYMRYALYPQWINEKAIEDRISFLQREIGKNPTYVDLYVELSRCYLEHARMTWKKGVEQYKKTLDINPGLTKLAAHLQEAEDTYDRINEAVKKIAE
ncbi:MAG: tetratricopeptide repeat protein [Candidatus Zixiibacteriota bacterium]